MENAKRPTSTTEAIGAQLNSVRDWDVLSGLLMQERGLALMPARIKAAGLLQGGREVAGADADLRDRAHAIAGGNMAAGA